MTDENRQTRVRVRTWRPRQLDPKIASESAPAESEEPTGLSADADPSTIRKVGKNSPPVHGQIKKGEVRNPKGRPKGSKNTKTLITEALNQKVQVKGIQGKVSLRNLAIIKQVRKAAEGDTKAFQLLLQLEGYSPTGEHDAIATAGMPISEKDKAILDHWNEQIKKDLKRSALKEVSDVESEK